MIEGTTKEKLVQVEVLTLDKEIFEQIEVPILEEESLDDLVKTAEEHSIALVIDKDEQVWIIIQGSNRLWRWSPLTAEFLIQAIGKYPWLGELPQVFLVKRRRK